MIVEEVVAAAVRMPWNVLQTMEKLLSGSGATLKDQGRRNNLHVSRRRRGASSSGKHAACVAGPPKRER